MAEERRKWRKKWICYMICRYLELQSSGRKDELRLHYVSRRDGTVHVEAFPFRLADGAWHRVALSVSGSQVELLVDCHPLYRRLLRPGPPDTNFTLPQLQLWVGQRNVRHFLFKVRVSHFSVLLIQVRVYLSIV